MVHVVVTLLGAVLVATTLMDAFESLVLPRRASPRLRLSRPLVRLLWSAWRTVARGLAAKPRPAGDGFRAVFLGSFGPFVLLLLFATWALLLIVGFAGLHWGFRSRAESGGGGWDFGQDLYFSGTTFFTLGIGDLAPATAAGKALTAVEAGTGFGFLALVIGYLPLFAQAFSARETSIALLDARAGTPPSAAELLRRLDPAARPHQFEEFLAEWERWAAQVLEHTLAYPMLAYYRSQHARQSWVAALTTVLDACALTLTGIDGVPTHQARLTFAMARHAAVDLAAALRTESVPPALDRLPPAELSRLRTTLTAAGLPLRDGDDADRELADYRGLYEPHVAALARLLEMPLPAWALPLGSVDEWLDGAPALPRHGAEDRTREAPRLHQPTHHPAPPDRDGGED